MGVYTEKIKTDGDNDDVMEPGIASPVPIGRITSVAPDSSLVKQYKLTKNANTTVVV